MRILTAIGFVLVAAVFLVMYLAVRAGLSTRSEPTAAERIVARAARRLAVPSGVRDRKNPVPFSPAVWAEASAHFADHCAICHGNDGSGQTELGRALYPRSPDMRQPDTQGLSDGELYWIIENGVRLTGMPAWGQGGPDDLDTWKLVHFLRRLKELTPEQLGAMQLLNPRSPAELEEERADERFLAGEEVGPSPHAAHVH